MQALAKRSERSVKCLRITAIGTKSKKKIEESGELESLMRVIKVIKPRVMIVSEVEANHNSPVFVNRFLETLFYYGAEFDVLEDCMKNDELNRLNLEAFYFSKSIHSIISAEGEERTFRHVKIEVWRAFFCPV
ncbi:hypothetical protein Leryth_021432 [Lithospermum erythrorhizon]|nr:hypothetical protein Leryth_021432 [Lithospermum erythrorhizon]